MCNNLLTVKGTTVKTNNRGFLITICGNISDVYLDRMLAIRPVEDSDFGTLFEFQSDLESCQMATVPPKTREAYQAHIEKIRANPDCIIRIIEDESTIVGFALSWLAEEGRNLGYWIGRDFWGRGYASQGLALLLQELTERPLVAHVANTNPASKRVLEKNGFVYVSSQTVDESPLGQFELMEYRL
jgi:RimJ/RimL family protein N-acetyltransferase